MKKKTSLKINVQSIKKFFAILVVFLLVFGIGYILGVFSMNMVPKVAVNDYDSIQNKDDKRVTSLINTLMAGGDCWNVEDFANDHKVDVKNISDDRIYQVVQWNSFYGNGSHTISLEDFNSEIKKYFSIGFDFDPEKINRNGCNAFSYDSEKQEFIALKIACASNEQICGPNRTMYKIMKVEDNGFYLNVTINVLFGSQSESVKFYSDYERTNYVTNDYDHIDNYYDQGDSYQFTFLRVDDQYLFVSSEKI